MLGFFTVNNVSYFSDYYVNHIIDNRANLVTLDEQVLSARNLFENSYPVFLAASRGLDLESLLIGTKLWTDAIHLVDSIIRLPVFVLI